MPGEHPLLRSLNRIESLEAQVAYLMSVCGTQTSACDEFVASEKAKRKADRQDKRRRRERDDDDNDD